MEKNVKYKIKPVPVAILCACVLAVIIGVVAIVSNAGRNDNTNPTVGVQHVGGEAQSVSEPEKIKVTVDIDMDDCTLTTDQAIQVTATVEPADTDTAVIWKSSDESVMEVGSDGIIRAKKTGVAALTATVGNVTDAIVVKWVSPQNGTSSVPNGSPDGSSQVGSTTPGGNTKPSESTTPGGNTKPSESTTPGGSTAPGGSTKPSESTTPGGNTKPSESTTPGGSTKPSESTTPGGSMAPGGSTKPSESTTPGGNTKPSEGTTPGGSTKPSESITPGGSTAAEPMKSTDLYGELEAIGFLRHISNVYKYEADGKYCGEVLIESNVAIIYIRERNSSFENAVMEVLTRLLPNNAKEVWSTYVNAGSDTTFMVGDRKVRIVIAKNGGHSQIVVYN